MSFLQFFFRRRSKHQKLCEEWALTSSRECIEVAKRSLGKSAIFRGFKLLKEATFTLKYLGSTFVDTPSDEEVTAEAIRTVVNMTKLGERTTQKVNLTVNLHGIWLRDAETNEEELQFSIYKISYCSADSSMGHIFAFIATNSDDTMECHAFLCHKGKVARIVTLTVAYAFNTAYEDWQMSQANPSKLHMQDEDSADDSTSEEDAEIQDILNKARKGREDDIDLLVDLSCDDYKPEDKPWVLFDDESVEYEDMHFRSPLNNVPMGPIRDRPSTSHAIPRPIPQRKVAKAWGEASSANLNYS